MQRERHLKKYYVSGCPRQHFIQDLVWFIKSKVILAVDIDKCTIDMKLLNELRRIGIIDAFGKKFNPHRLSSYVTRNKPIDIVWAIDDAMSKKFLSS